MWYNTAFILLWLEQIKVWLNAIAIFSRHYNYVVTGFECKINKQICVAVKAEDSKGSHPCFKKTDVYFRDYSVKPAANGMEITLKMHSYSQILYLGYWIGLVEMGLNSWDFLVWDFNFIK